MKNTFLQKGLSLVVVFFIMTVILSIVLGLIVIVLNSAKSAKNVGDSVIAFYAADSGIEKTLFYNRQRVPTGIDGIVGGICDICSSCGSNCSGCSAIGEDCRACKHCRVAYNMNMDNLGQNYQVVVNVLPNGKFYNMKVTSKGYYNSSARAIGMQISNRDVSSSAPDISETLAIKEYNNVTISAKVTDPDLISSVTAHIRIVDDPKIPDIETKDLIFQENDLYSNTWLPIDNKPYFIYIRACDSLSNCAQSDTFAINSN